MIIKTEQKTFSIRTTGNGDVILKYRANDGTIRQRRFTQDDDGGPVYEIGPGIRGKLLVYPKLSTKVRFDFALEPCDDESLQECIADEFIRSLSA